MLKNVNTGSGASFSDKFVKGVVDGTSQSLLESAVYGTDLTEALKKNLRSQIVKVGTSEILTHAVKPIDADTLSRNIAHKLAAALTGCISATANKQDCEAGAIGAAVGEMWGDWRVDAQTQKLIDDGILSEGTDAYNQIVNQSKLIAGIAAAFAEKDVNVAAGMAEEAVRWNNIRRVNRTNLTQQQRNDMVRAQIYAIRRHLPSFNGFSRATRRGDSNYSQAELDEYIAFRRFIETTTQTFPNQYNAELAFRQWQKSPVYNNPLYMQGIHGNTITMSSHANSRKLIGRNTQTARGDLQRARLSDIFVQPDGRFIIRGSNSREHIIEPNGEVVTTINRRSKSAHEQKIRNGERRQAMQIEFDYIKSFQ